MNLEDVCTDCIKAVLDEDLLPIITELDARGTPALAASREKEGGYTEFTFFKHHLNRMMAIAREEDHQSWEFFKYDCCYDVDLHICSCCGDKQPTMTLRFPTLATKDFVRATAIRIYDEWYEEFYPEFYS